MRTRSGRHRSNTRIPIRMLAIGLALVLATAATAAIPSHASRTRRCKAISVPQVVGSLAVGATLHAHHGKWVCQGP